MASHAVPRHVTRLRNPDHLSLLALRAPLDCNPDRSPLMLIWVYHTVPFNKNMSNLSKLSNENKSVANKFKIMPVNSMNCTRPVALTHLPVLRHGPTAPQRASTENQHIANHPSRCRVGVRCECASLRLRKRRKIRAVTDAALLPSAHRTRGVRRNAPG